MKVTIVLPTSLRRFVGGGKQLDVVAHTAAEALTLLADRSNDLRRQLFDEQGRLRSFVKVFLGSDELGALAPGGQEVPVRDGDVLTLVLAVAGG